jgi:hypothetical protein
MNKFFAFILAISMVSITTSCTKENSVSPTAKAKTTIVADKSELGVGD